MKLKIKNNRRLIYRFSFFFTIIYFVLIYFQKRVLSGLFQTQLSFSVPDLVSIFMSENGFESLIGRAKSGAILTGGFLAFEILVFIGVIVFLLYRMFRLYKDKDFRKHDFVLLGGLVVLLFGSIYFAYALGRSSYDTYATIESAIRPLTPSQIQALLNKWKEFIYNYQFSLNYLPRDISIVVDQVKAIISSVKEIAALPDVVSNWLDHLSVLKVHYFITMCVGFITVVVGEVLEYRIVGNFFARVKNKASFLHPQSNDKLIQILENQQSLMEDMFKLQSEMYEDSKKNNESVKK